MYRALFRYGLILLLLALAASPLPSAVLPWLKPSIASTVVKMPLAKGVSIDDAISSMKLRASLLNFKLVAHQPLSQQIAATGMKNVRRLEIYQFCNPLTAYDMVRYNMAYAAYLPCRIAVVEDAQGKGWLVMLDPKRLLSSGMPAALRKRANAVIDNLTQIMNAGAEGAL